MKMTAMEALGLVPRIHVACTCEYGSGPRRENRPVQNMLKFPGGRGGGEQRTEVVRCVETNILEYDQE